MHILDKQALRKKILSERQSLSLDIQQQDSQQICQHILNLKIVQQAHTIALYLGYKGEVDTHFLIKELQRSHKITLLPVLKEDKSLQFFPYQSGDLLTPNKFGILEPAPKSEIQPQNIDIILMPLVAFDIKGNRVGSGAGYYDRTLEFLREKNRAAPYLIGLAYELQKIPQIEADPWDIPLNLIVTEKKVYEILAHEI